MDAAVECRYWQDDFAWKPVIGAEYIFYSGENEMDEKRAKEFMKTIEECHSEYINRLNTQQEKLRRNAEEYQAKKEEEKENGRDKEEVYNLL